MFTVRLPPIGEAVSGFSYPRSSGAQGFSCPTHVLLEGTTGVQQGSEEPGCEKQNVDGRREEKGGAFAETVQQYQLADKGFVLHTSHLQV